MSKDTINISKPHQTILVCASGTFESIGKIRKLDNIITIDWHMPTSIDPPLYCISLGKNRFSLNLIRESNCFSVNFMSHDYEKEVVFCGSTSGVKTDKFKETGLTKKECEKIDSVYIKEAESVYECELVGEKETGDHVILIGRIIQKHEFNDRRRLINAGKKGFTTTMK